MRDGSLEPILTHSDAYTFVPFLARKGGLCRELGPSSVALTHQTWANSIPTC